MLLVCPFAFAFNPSLNVSQYAHAYASRLAVCSYQLGSMLSCFLAPESNTRAIFPRRSVLDFNLC